MMDGGEDRNDRLAGCAKMSNNVLEAFDILVVGDFGEEGQMIDWAAVTR